MGLMKLEPGDACFVFDYQGVPHAGTVKSVSTEASFVEVELHREDNSVRVDKFYFGTVLETLPGN